MNSRNHEGLSWLAITWSSYAHILVLYTCILRERYVRALMYRCHLASRSSNLKPRMPVALERKGWTNNMRTYRSLRCMMLTFAHSLLTDTVPDSIRLTQPSLRACSSKTMGLYSKSREITKSLARQPLASHKQLPVCVTYQSASIVPRCVVAWYSRSRDQPVLRCYP